VNDCRKKPPAQVDLYLAAANFTHYPNTIN